MSTETMPQSTENSFEGADNDELARRISDIDNALQVYSDGEESNLKRGEMRRDLFEELERRMNGDTAAAADLVERIGAENLNDELAA
ncbi:MAG: hypothetical protein Q7S53_05435 [bacterium]|nr:hypothetical protein [bacterium]